jgi:hypothetical protein
MKPILIILCATFLALACGRTENWSVELNKIVANKTGKTLFYEVKTDEGSESALVNAYDSIGIRFYREHEVEMSWLEVVLTSTVRQNRIRIEQEVVFNLNDTSKYEYVLEYEGLPLPGRTEEEKIFGRHLTKTLGERSTDKNVMIIVTLNVTDSILRIMQKDYTMLEKFKEHYAAK